jgi:hypothetical protein
MRFGVESAFQFYIAKSTKESEYAAIEIFIFFVNRSNTAYAQSVGG